LDADEVAQKVDETTPNPVEENDIVFQLPQGKRFG
jgi:hypothetical protein